MQWGTNFGLKLVPWCCFSWFGLCVMLPLPVFGPIFKYQNFPNYELDFIVPVFWRSFNVFPYFPNIFNWVGVLLIICYILWTCYILTVSQVGYFGLPIEALKNDWVGSSLIKLSYPSIFNNMSATPKMCCKFFFGWVVECCRAHFLPYWSLSRVGYVFLFPIPPVLAVLIDHEGNVRVWPSSLGLVAHVMVFFGFSHDLDYKLCHFLALTCDKCCELWCWRASMVKYT